MQEVSITQAFAEPIEDKLANVKCFIIVDAIGPW